MDSVFLNPFRNGFRECMKRKLRHVHLHTKKERIAAVKKAEKDCRKGR